MKLPILGHPGGASLALVHLDVRPRFVPPHPMHRGSCSTRLGFPLFFRARFRCACSSEVCENVQCTTRALFPALMAAVKYKLFYETPRAMRVKG